MERKIYLIFADRVDTVCEIKGYIRGTEDEAQAYCLELNKNTEDRPEEFVWMELPQLSIHEIWKTTMPAGFTTVPKTAEKWGVTKAHVYNLCKEGRIPGVIYANDHWCIPEDAEKPSAKKQTDFLNATEAAKKWGIYKESVSWLCTEGEIPGAERIGQVWRIPKDAVNPLEGYIMISQLARQWGMNRINVSEYCLEGRIPGAKRVGRNWYVPANAEKPMDIRTNRKDGYTSPTKLAEKWGTSRNFVCKACREGRIPGAEFIDGYWHIPEDAVRPLRATKSANRRSEQKTSYLSATEAAEKWGTSPMFVKKAARNGVIPGAINNGRGWQIPEDAVYPGSDGTRRK